MMGVPVMGMLLMVLGLALQAQPIRATTEFARFTHRGEPFPQDGVRQPLEVLSPPLIRGTWNAFRLVVDVEPGENFRLYVGQNPNNAMRVRIFREVVQKDAEGWGIAARQMVLLPFDSKAIPAAERAAERTTYTFWMEVQPPRNYRPRRLKLEPQLLLNDQWFTYPMEIRVLDLDVDLSGLPGRAVPDATAERPAAEPDFAYAMLLRQALCGDGEATFVEAAAGLQPLDRERESAASFAPALDALARKHSREDVDRELLRVLRIDDRKAWCAAPEFPRDRLGVEWPAALKNRVLQLAGDPYD
jgi:hypothetical protein